MKRKKEDMDEELCNYCPLPEGSNKMCCYGGLPFSCEGSRCDEAYEAYLESEDDDEEEAT
jgi:hypothetical protein